MRTAISGCAAAAAAKARSSSGSPEPRRASCPPRSTKAGQRLEQEVEALLVREARDDDGERAVVSGRPNSRRSARLLRALPLGVR
jgi:hypothetical protein